MGVEGARSAKELLDADWKVQLADNPEFASQAGRNQYDDRLQDLSPAAFAARAAHDRAVLRAIERLLPSASVEHALSLRLLQQSVADELEGFDLGCHLYPVNSIGYGGVHNNFIEALDWLSDTPGADHNLLSRLEAFPQQVQGYLELLRCGMAQGKVASRAMLRKVPQQLEEVASSLQDPSGPIASRVAALPESSAGRGARAVDAFHRAILTVKRFFAEEYEPRETNGCAGLPRGEETYALCLRFHTTTQLSADEIHQIGMDEVARIAARFQVDVFDKMNFTGSFSEFVEKLHADPQYYYENAEDLLEGYRTITERIRVLLPPFFKTFPSSSLEIVEKHAESAPAAYYMQGTADGARPGRFYVNTSHLNKRPTYDMPSLALHEGIPGHHHQGSLAIENPSIPDFMRFIEDRRYEFCPARRQLYAAYLEGWALYCEALGEEMGLYTDPESMFGRLAHEMMRAVRLVVDTGIHSKGWSVERAIDYMVEHTGMHREEAEAECYRYEAWPGQACAYKIGEVAIWRARRAAEEVLGHAFDLRALHEVILERGPMPLDLLASVVHEWAQNGGA